MSEDPNTGDLALLAFLYASGELDPAETAGFEQRLGSDQDAREALVQAVQATLPLTSPAATGPSPSYRDGVRRRLRPTWWKRLLTDGSLRGHRLLWAAAGAAVAASVVLAIFLNREPVVRMVEVPVIQRVEVPVAVVPPENRGEGTVEVSADVMADMANVWADLSNPDHVSQAVDGENKRRSRNDDWRQFRRTMQQMVVDD